MKKQLLGLLLFVAIPTFLFAQETTEKSKGELNDYLRSSLHSMMIVHPEDTFGTYIYQAFDSIPIPDKFYDHNMGFRWASNEEILGAQKEKAGLIKAATGKTLSKKDIEKNAAALEKFLNDNEVGKRMVAKWWNLQQPDTTQAPFFDYKLVEERGQYSKKDSEVELAKLTERGTSQLGYEGKELIGNTYLLVNDITYVSPQERQALQKTGVALGGLLFGALEVAFGGDGSIAKNLTNSALQIVDGLEGFKVKTHSYLFRLQWNEEVESTFDNLHWSDASAPNADNIAAFFADTSTYKVKYVAHEYEFDAQDVTKGQYPQSELVKMICTRSLDKNIAALQKQYEDFKVKTPIKVLYNDRGKVVGYTAEIGMKEGITEKSEFQVVDRRFDEKTNRITYRRVARLKVQKGKLWDNRYNAVTEEAPGSDLTATTFKKVSGGEITEGMLIIEGEYKRAVD